MSRYFEFNTQRPYTEQGQIIRCYKEPYGEHVDDAWTVYFYDVSRNVIGRLESIWGLALGNDEIMRRYDNGEYKEEMFSSRGIREIIRHFGETV